MENLFLWKFHFQLTNCFYGKFLSSVGTALMLRSLKAAHVWPSVLRFPTSDKLQEQSPHLSLTPMHTLPHKSGPAMGATVFWLQRQYTHGYRWDAWRINLLMSQIKIHYRLLYISCPWCPDTDKAVIDSSNIFTCTRDGRLARVLNKAPQDRVHQGERTWGWLLCDYVDGHKSWM